jgi:hypothetical protein
VTTPNLPGIDDTIADSWTAPKAAPRAAPRKRKASSE